MPKGTLPYWWREIKLTEEQVAAIRERVNGAREGVPVDYPVAAARRDR